MTELQPIVVALAGLISAAYGVLSGNIGAIFSLLSPLLQLKSVDWSKVKADVLALADADRATLEAAFDGALSIPNQAVLAKIAEAGHALNMLITVAEQGYGVYQGAVAVYFKFKEIVTGVHAQQIAEGKMSMTLPISIPGVPGWLVSLAAMVLTNFLLPEIAKLVPGAAPVIADIIAFLNGQLHSAVAAHVQAQAAEKVGA